MNDTDQRIAIAEACGWKHCMTQINREEWTLPGHSIPSFVRMVDEPKQPLPIPDYLNDLNAIRIAEMGLNKEGRRIYAQLMREAFWGELWEFQAITATAAQRSEVFLRTIGKWKDK